MGTTSTRRLAAVLIADVAGYSRLMERDEAGTHARLTAVRAAVTDPAVHRHEGRIVRSVGDGFLAVFPSALAALQAAVEIQREMASRNRPLPAEARLDHRIGVNLGDILVEERDIAGTGVNVAARLEALAPPGGIAVSAAVREQARHDLDVRFVDAGRQRVKNLSRPVRVFRIDFEPSASPPLRLARRPRRAVAVAAATLAAAAAIGHALLPRSAAPAPLLVVLPFSHPLPEQRALAESLTGEVTAAVSRLSGLTVVAPAVAAGLGDRRGGMKDLRRALNVRYALDGLVERRGGDVRATVHLVDTTTGGSLWSREIDAPAAAGGAAVPLALVGQMSDALRAAVRLAELSRLAAEGATRSAYAQALSAIDELERSTDPRQVPAIRARFEHALQADADHVPALAGYAHALVYEADQSAPGAQAQALLRRADAASLRAVTLRPDDAEAWAARANALFFLDRLDAAAEAVERGVALNPYLVELQLFAGRIDLARDRGEQALAAFDRGIALNPTGPSRGVLAHFRCRALLLLGRHAEAIEACERGMAFGAEWPDFMVLAAASALHGDARRAAQAGAELLRMQPGFSIRWYAAQSGRGEAPTRFDRALEDGLRRAGLPE